MDKFNQPDALYQDTFSIHCTKTVPNVQLNVRPAPTLQPVTRVLTLLQFCLTASARTDNISEDNV